MVFAWCNVVILLMISAMHLFWAFGGRWGANAAVPETTGTREFTPGVVATLVVAVLFFGMAVVHLSKVGVLPLQLPGFTGYGLWAVSVIFLIRAIGEFRYIGFFKREKGSLFARLDTRFYSPLCLLIAFNAMMTALSEI
jgi:hypothetical protein